MPGGEGGGRERLRGPHLGRIPFVSRSGGESEWVGWTGARVQQTIASRRARAVCAAGPSRLWDSELDDRVAFHLRDAADETLAGRYDLVYIHEALHDMSYRWRRFVMCARPCGPAGA